MNDALALEATLQSIAAETEGTFAFYAHDLDSDQRALVRADEAFPAASVIKLPILLRALELVRDGEAALGQPVQMTTWQKTGGSGILQHFHDSLEVTLADACLAMIALSDNTATNMVLDTTGITPVNAMLDRLGCPRTRLHRYLGKPEMPGPSGPSQAVPAEIGRLLEHLVRREVLTPTLCQTAMIMLRRQNHRALIPRLLPERTPVAHKTGSLDGVRHDVGIIWRPPDAPTDRTTDEEGRGGMPIQEEGFAAGHPIVFVGMSRDVADRRWTVENDAEQAIARAARAVYDFFVGKLGTNARKETRAQAAS
jgi:beta-lactamase class A